jgi:translation initiation factor IF-2
MRIYEFAKKINLSNKDILSLLAQNGFEFKSHMAALTPEALDFLNKKFNPESVSQVKAPVIEQPVEKITTKAVQPTMQQQPVQKPREAGQPSSAPKPSVQKPEIRPHEATRSREVIAEQPRQMQVTIEPMALGTLADLLSKPASELIIALLRQGVVCTKNQILTEKQVEAFANQFGFTAIAKQRAERKEQGRTGAQVAGEHTRKPIVVVIGHVDHGKTTLLDFIRKTRIAAREKGGITQHLGAYEAETPQGSIIFLDTPGHEAFKNIRGRGLNIADIAVLVVAADDSVMPQTIEALKTAQAAQVPIIVAINKVDKVEQTRLEVVKRDLARYDLVPEEWGGSAICVPISGKTGKGVDQLLEMIILQSQLMDLKTEKQGPASGFILESKFEKGRGPVATVICRTGTLRIGDYFAAGGLTGKVSSLINSAGQQLKEAGPSVPVQVAGFSDLTQAGELFSVVTEQEYRKIKDGRQVVGAAISALSKKIATSHDGINFIIKTDSTLTQEALLESLAQLVSKSDEKFNIIATGVGDITARDVMLAADTDSEIIGLHVKTEANALQESQKQNIEIHHFDIIYKLLENVEERLIKAAPIKMVSKKIGEAVVRKVFDIKNIGVIAGSYVKEGRFTKEGRVVVWRGKKKIGEGKIKGLERDRKSVKEVHAGFEFAFLADGIESWEIDDRVECFIDVPAT